MGRDASTAPRVRLYSTRAFANEWLHCERTRHLGPTNYQSLSRNNKVKPWKKIPVKSIAFHMHLTPPRRARVAACNRRAKIKLKAECCGKKHAAASVSFVCKGDMRFSPSRANFVLTKATQKHSRLRAYRVDRPKTDGLKTLRNVSSRNLLFFFSSLVNIFNINRKNAACS